MEGCRVDKRVKSELKLYFPLGCIPYIPPSITSTAISHQKETLLPDYVKNIWGNHMDKYENHMEKRIREIHERMRKLGNKKSLT
jgi:hypothetical protein